MRETVKNTERGFAARLSASDSREEVSDRQTAEPLTSELYSSWADGAKKVLCINSFPNGVTFSVHQPRPSRNNAESEPGSLSEFFLRTRDTRELRIPAGRYSVAKDDYREALERQLLSLAQQKTLSETTVYFGCMSDPFYGFQKRFNVTMGVLDLLEKYQVGRLVVQSRSPMIIAALPTLKYYEDRAVAVLPIESYREDVIQHYTPGQPRIAERLIAARGLRAQGVRVQLDVAPILPYGDIYRNAWDFAEILDSHGDFITFNSLVGDTMISELELRKNLVADRLERDKQFYFLRPHAFESVYAAVKILAPEKLVLPVEGMLPVEQLQLFAA